MAHPVAVMKGKSDTKRKLIDAAHALIWANSYAQTSVDDICRAAGVQKGSFYHFFPTKSDLAAAALEDKWQHSCAMFDALLTGTNDAREQLRGLCDLILSKQKEGLAETGMVCGCPYATVGSQMNGEHVPLRELSVKMSESFCDYFEKILKNAAKAGLIPNKGLRGTAREMHMYTMGAMLEARLTNDLKVVGAQMHTALLRLSRMDALAQKTPRKH